MLVNVDSQRVGEADEIFVAHSASCGVRPPVLIRDPFIPHPFSSSRRVPLNCSSVLILTCYCLAVEARRRGCQNPER